MFFYSLLWTLWRARLTEESNTKPNKATAKSSICQHKYPQVGCLRPRSDQVFIYFLGCILPINSLLHPCVRSSSRCAFRVAMARDRHRAVFDPGPHKGPTGAGQRCPQRCLISCYVPLMRGSVGVGAPNCWGMGPSS